MRPPTDDMQELAKACDRPDSELNFLGVIVPYDKAKRFDVMEEENERLRQKVANLTVDIERLQAENKELSEPDTIVGVTNEHIWHDPFRIVSFRGQRSFTCYGFVTTSGVVIATNSLDKAQSELQRYLAEHPDAARKWGNKCGNK